MSRRKWSLLIGLIGSVVFNVGWWISYPPMVFAGVLLAGPGWICGSRDERRENVDENKEKARLRRAQRAALMNSAQGKIFTVTYQDYQKPEVLRTDLNSLPAVCSPALKACTLNTDSSKPAAEPEHRGLTAEES